MSSRTEETLVSQDGKTKLFVRKWNPAAKPIARVVIMHGYLEHGGRYREFAEYLATEHSISTVAHDLRGHGKSSGQRGHTSSMQDYFTDLETVLEFANKFDDDDENKAEGSSNPPLFILAHSFGGLTFLDYSRDNKQLDKFHVAGAIVSCPFVDYAEHLSGMKVLLSKVLGSIVPRLSMPVEELPAVNLTHDEEKQKEHDADENMIHNFTVGWALECLKAQVRVRETVPIPLSVPILYLQAEEDKVSDPVAVNKVGENIEQKDKTVVERKGEYHEVLNEVKRQETYDIVADWIVKRCK